MNPILAFFSKYRVYLLLALIVCGPVMVLPHVLPVFNFAVAIESVLMVIGGLLCAALCLYAHVAPDTFREATVATATAFLGRTRAEKFFGFCGRSAGYLNVVLLVLTSHPVVAAAMLFGQVAYSLYKRVLAKIHAAASVASAVASFKKD